MGMGRAWLACCLVVAASSVAGSCHTVFVVDVQGWSILEDLTCLRCTHACPSKFRTCTYVAADLPQEQKLPASVLIGLLNRQAGVPTAIGKINPTDDAWVQSVRAEELTLRNATLQQVASFEELATVSREAGA
jgi:hypothetical protein